MFLEFSVWSGLTTRWSLKESISASKKRDKTVLWLKLTEVEMCRIIRNKESVVVKYDVSRGEKTDLTVDDVFNVQWLNVSFIYVQSILHLLLRRTWRGWLVEGEGGVKNAPDSPSLSDEEKKGIPIWVRKGWEEKILVSRQWRVQFWISHSWDDDAYSDRRVS